ncbi:MAG TPA: T9SS type A sorting domain-containing protein [Chitinophagaceae bacterium]|nr:T9SS type A sorting domain-containing protein [Chitinophagaceae bacterium]
MYASILLQRFCVDQQEPEKVLLQNFRALPLIQGGPCGLPEDLSRINNDNSALTLKMPPVPYGISGTIQLSTNGGNTVVQQIDGLGRVVKVPTNQNYAAGTYNIDVYNDGLPTGAYFLRLQNGALQKVVTILKERQPVIQMCLLLYTACASDFSRFAFHFSRSKTFWRRKPKDAPDV